jgi:hypothetical protein
MPEYQPRGRELTWPQPWEGIGYDWTAGCRVQYLAAVTPGMIAAAKQDLIETLAKQPHAFWCFEWAARQLASEFNLPAHLARKLLRDTPGSAMPQPNVWCAAGVAASWPDRKATALNAIPNDSTLTHAEISEAVKAEVDATTCYCALVTLTDTDKTIVCLQDDKTDEPRFCRAKPGGLRASYTVLG